MIRLWMKKYNMILKEKQLNWNSYIDSSKQINSNDPKLKVGDTVRISKYENISAKGYTLNWSEEVIVIMLLMILIEKKFLERFTEKNCKNNWKRI